MNAPIAWQGAKKGAKTPRQPVESPDSLRSIAYAKILDLVAEGEVKGLVAPGFEGLKGVFLDGTPIQGQDGTINFDNVTFDFRSGSQDQTYIPGFPSVENEISIGVELRSDSPVVRNVTNSDLSAVRVRLSVPSLQQTDTSNGDIKGYSIQYAIDVSTDGGAYSTVLTTAMTGKTTGGYERSHRIDLPEGNSRQVRIRRLTANRDMATIADAMFVQSITEIIDAKLRYPNSALSALIIDASQFQSVPTRSFFGDWRIIRVPTNYDPELRTYTGLWDGTFKAAWSNNPAWVYFDLCTNDRFGLGNLIDPERVDKWRLYQIAQYCDQMVSDGMGGQEPRFTFNAQIQTRADAYRVLQDMAATFRGISFYALGQVMAAADMPADPVYTYTAANVVDGRFTYQGTARRARHTYALVSWNDPSDFGRAKVEPVEYRPGITRLGLQPLEITAFGCTSRAQAQRVGLHALLSENLETETVTFRVGLDGAIAQPYDVIQIADPSRAGRRIGGRIRSATVDSVTLDRAPDTLAAGQTLRMMLPTGRSEARTIESVADNLVTVTVPWSVLPQKDAVWAVESADLALQTFRVLSVTEVDDVTYELTALKHVPQKFAAIDDGVRIELPPVTVIPPSVQAPPANVALASHSVIEQGIATNVLTISWDAAPKAVAYDVEWRREDLDWVRAGRVAAASLDVRGIYAGAYVARVRAVSALGGLSVPAIGGPTDILGKTTPPPSLASLDTEAMVFGIGLKWTFPAGASDTERTEIWYGPSPLLENAIKLGDFAYPQNSHQMLGLAAGASFFFWGRLVDKSGNIGPFYPVGAGVNGQSSSDAGPILDYLAGQISKTELAQELLEPIEQMSPEMAGEADAFAGNDLAFAGVWSQLYAQQEGDMATAGQVETIQATVDQTTAVVQQSAQTVVDLDGKISATYTVRAQVDTNGRIYIAGLGVGVEQQPDGSYQSQILFQADRLALINVANGALSSPFVIQNGQTFINQGFIGNGWIQNAMIGDVIQSTATGANGQPRWKLDKSGTITLTGPSGSGYLTITDSLIQVFNASGTLLVRLGDW